MDNQQGMDISSGLIMGNIDDGLIWFNMNT
jgi:hypothetical protein